MLLNLCLDYIRRRQPGRRLGVFHIDYEMQYRETIDYVDRVLASNADVLDVYRVCALQGLYLYFDVSELLAALGAVETGVVGTPVTRGGLYSGRFRFLRRYPVGL